MATLLPSGGTNTFVDPREIGDIAAYLTSLYAATDDEPADMSVHFNIRGNMPLPVACAHVVTETNARGSDVKEFIMIFNDDPAALQAAVNVLITPPSGALVSFITSYGAWYTGDRTAITHGALVYRRYAP